MLLNRFFIVSVLIKGWSPEMTIDMVGIIRGVSQVQNISVACTQLFVLNYISYLGRALLLPILFHTLLRLLVCHLYLTDYRLEQVPDHMLASERRQNFGQIAFHSGAFARR